MAQATGSHEHRRHIKSVFLVTGMDLEKVQQICQHNCSCCICGKTCRKPQKPQSAENKDTTQLLVRVYTDVSGPIRHNSFSGSQDFVTIFEERTGFSLVRFVRRKSQAVNAVN